MLGLNNPFCGIEVLLSNKYTLQIFKLFTLKKPLIVGKYNPKELKCGHNIKRLDIKYIYWVVPSVI